ncbi:Phosphoenolpyruvate synthase, partial [hydrothermal vent metagenome]
MSDYIIKLDQLTLQDLDQVGGKNASLGEMITHLNGLGVKVPGGFATTADAFKEFLQTSGLNQRISDTLKNLDTDNIDDLRAAGKKIRDWVMETPFQAPLEQAIRAAYSVMKAELG